MRKLNWAIGKVEAEKLRQGDLETEEFDLRWWEGGRETGKLEGRESETQRLRKLNWEIGKVES